MLILSIVGAFLLTLSGSDLVWAEAHVPLGGMQLCHNGETLNTAVNVLENFLSNGEVYRHPNPMGLSPRSPVWWDKNSLLSLEVACVAAGLRAGRATQEKIPKNESLRFLLRPLVLEPGEHRNQYDHTDRA